MSRKIIGLVKDGDFVIFELEDGSLETKDVSLTNSQSSALIGADYDEVFGGNHEVSTKKTVEVDAEVWENMVNQMNQMSDWQAEQRHNQLENSRLTDILNRRRSGEDSGPTKADLMESERAQNRTLIYEERKLIFKEKSEYEKREFIKNENNKIRHSLEKFGNMTGSPMQARPGEGQEEFNNRIFGGGSR